MRERKREKERARERERERERKRVCVREAGTPFQEKRRAAQKHNMNRKTHTFAYVFIQRRLQEREKVRERDLSEKTRSLRTALSMSPSEVTTPG